jgi:hypothetical protein
MQALFWLFPLGIVLAFSCAIRLEHESDQSARLQPLPCLLHAPHIALLTSCPLCSGRHVGSDTVELVFGGRWRLSVDYGHWCRPREAYFTQILTFLFVT